MTEKAILGAISAMWLVVTAGTVSWWLILWPFLLKKPRMV